jgi:TIGR00159 family protein
MWMNFGIKDFIDVILVAVVLYQTYKLMKNSGTLAVFSGIISFILVWIVVSQVLEMRLLGAIMDKVVSVGILVLVILFQDEIRRFLVILGSHRGWTFLSRIFSSKKKVQTDKQYVAAVVLACMNLTKKKMGALIAIQQDMDLSLYIHTGEKFDADANARLIENIFFRNSPLHDGAMIIANNRICAAGCILPVAQNLDFPKELGLRHRSALGLSLESDALVIVVSEERGKISVAHNGKLEISITTETLQQILSGEREVVNFC